LAAHKKQARYRKGFASQLRTDRSKTFYLGATNLLCYPGFYLLLMPSYLTKGEIEASKQRLPYACLFKEASIDKRKQEIEAKPFLSCLLSLAYACLPCVAKRGKRASKQLRTAQR
jgi:hypothetical protein